MWKPIGVGVLVLGMLAVAAGCGSDGGAAAPTVVPVTAEVGGMALATAAAVDTAATAVPTTAATTATEEAAPIATPAEATGAVTPAIAKVSTQVAPAVLSPGAKVAAIGTLRLYTAPDARSAAMGQYEAGTTFEVVEPSGDFVGYPVDIDGVSWVRVRADDGLVGWVLAAAVEAAE